MTSPSADAFTLSRQFIAPTNVPVLPSSTQDWTSAVMLTWDPVSYANTVLLGGAVLLTNLPVCSPNGLTAGTVLLAKVPGSYIIMGNLGSAKTIGFIDPIRYASVRTDVPSPNTTMINAGTLSFLVNEGTQYAIDGCIFYNANTASDIKFAWTGPPNMACKWSAWGTQDTSLSTHLLFDTVSAYGDASAQELYGWGNSAVAHPKAWFSTGDTGGLLQYRFAQNTSNATPAILQAGSWMRIAELGPASGAQTYVKIYPATGSRSYDGNGNFIGSPDGDNNLYSWYLQGRNFGNESNMWTFNAAQLRSDVAGATILSAQMFYYCFASSSVPADWAWKWSTTSTIQATFPNNGFGGLDVKNLWVVPSWNGFDITAQISHVLNSNANSVLGGSYNFADSSTGMRGYGTTGYAPYLQITYSV